MENEKQIGLVKWFHDKSKDSNYGFIQHIKLGDLYFNENSIDRGQDINSFKENTIVTFLVITQESNKHKGKLKAIRVKYLDYETDILFLFSYFLNLLCERGRYSDYNIIQKGIHERISLLIEKSGNDKTIEQLYEKFLQYLNEQIRLNSIQDENYLKGLLNVSKGFFPNNIKKIGDVIETNISIELAHNLWLESFIDTCQIEYVAGIILSESEPTKQKIFSRCTENDFKQLFEHFIKHLNEKIHSTNITDSEFENILKVSKKFFSTNYEQITAIVERNISEELAHKLWLDSFIETCQIDYVASIILSEPEKIQQKILNRSSEDDKTNIFFKALYTIDKIDTDAKLKSVKQLLCLSKVYVSEQYEKVLAETIKNCPDFFRLDLWLEDYHETLDFHTYKLYTVTLSPKNQKKFVKKVLKYIHEGRLTISTEEFNSIITMDYETSKLSKNLENAHLDYSTSIVLNVISELHQQLNLEKKENQTIAKQKIFDLIVKQIKNPEDILEIRGFFDECKGRCRVSKIIELPNGEEIEGKEHKIRYERDKYDIPREICDGRKAINKLNNMPALSDEGLEYWWCANVGCYKPSRNLHTSDEWENYSLLDFLTILKIPFNEIDYEIYLSVINKANQFIKHLYCKECKCILHPRGQSNYAFWGVTWFKCKTETCSQKSKEIYLSHCLNGYCESVIDSRESKKCKPKGYDSESCGWFIFNECNACCSSKKLNKRKKVYDFQHKDYKCHEDGHKDLGIISCNKCGDTMAFNNIDVSEYERILNWFIENEKLSDRIDKSGKYSSTGLRWFTLKKGEDSDIEFKKRLTKCLKAGFKIPNFDKNFKNQLICEVAKPTKVSENVINCNTCGHIIDLTTNKEKAHAFKKYHNVFFKEDNS